MRAPMAVLWTISVLAVIPAYPQERIRVMLLDGEQAGVFHDWHETTPYLKRMLEETGRFVVDVVTAPPAGSDFSRFRPRWDLYRAIVANYDAPDERWPDELKTSLESYVRNGGGFVSYHAADNAFPNWREYNLMIGVGGWRGRNERWGPYWYFKDGKLVADPTPGPAGSHGARKPFQIVNVVQDHPITQGMPKTWMHAPDELYARLRGPGEKMTILSVAYSDPSNRGTDRDEPILMVVEYGKGRVFHTTLGHDIAAMNCVGFISTLQRGTEWAATGSVTIPVPRDFPAGDQIKTRPEYEPPEGWISPGDRPRRQPVAAKPPAQ